MNKDYVRVDETSTRRANETVIRIPAGNKIKITKYNTRSEFCFKTCRNLACSELKCDECIFYYKNRSFFKKWMKEQFKGER